MLFVLGALLGWLSSLPGSLLIHRLPLSIQREWEAAARAELGSSEVIEGGEHHPRGSACDTCNVRLRWHECIPLVSWTMSRGRCRHCNAPISGKYLALELASLAVGAGAFGLFGWSVQGGAVFAAGLLVLWAALIDAEHKLLPSCLVYPLLVLGMFSATQNWFVGPTDALYGAIIGFTLLGGLAWLWKALRGVDGLGENDAPFLAALGTFVGGAATTHALLTACFVAIALVIGARLFSKRKPEEQYLAFGPALAVGAALVFIAQHVT